MKVLLELREDTMTACVEWTMPRILGEYARVLLACKRRPYFTLDRCCWQMKAPRSYHLLSCVYRLEALFRAKPGDFSFGERARVDVISFLCLGAKCWDVTSLFGLTLKRNSSCLGSCSSDRRQLDEGSIFQLFPPIKKRSVPRRLESYRPWR